jgi:hypothetical protein
MRASRKFASEPCLARRRISLNIKSKGMISPLAYSRFRIFALLFSVVEPFLRPELGRRPPRGISQPRRRLLCECMFALDGLQSCRMIEPRASEVSRRSWRASSLIVVCCFLAALSNAALLPLGSRTTRRSG